MQGISSKTDELQLLILVIEQEKLQECQGLATVTGTYAFKGKRCSQRVETQVKTV